MSAQTIVVAGPRLLRDRLVQVERSIQVPRVDKSLLDPKRRRRFEALVRSRDCLMAGGSMREAAKVASMSERRLETVFSRYTKPADDGQVAGERAFNKGWRAHSGIRSAPLNPAGRSPGNQTGLFRKLLAENKPLRKAVVDTLRRRGKASLQPNRLVGRELRIALVDLLKRHGLTQDEYPLNTADQGLRALRRWIVSDFLPTYANDWIDAVGGPDASAGISTPRVKPIDSAIHDAYAEWVLDGVKVELRTAIEYLNAQGDMERIEVSRFVILRLIERGYGTTLAYVLVFAEEPNAFDVGNLLWRAVNGVPPPALVLPTLKLEAGAGFPANDIDELRWKAPRRVYLDNALAHLSTVVGMIVEQMFGAELCLGNPGAPLERAEIESRFSMQARRLIKQAPGTTGAHPKDSLRKRNENVPVDGLLLASELEHAYWAMLANENASVTHATNGVPGLERLRRAVIMGKVRAAPISLSYQTRHMFFPALKVRVHADLKHGRKPFVYGGRRVRYSSPALQMRYDLVGEFLYLKRDPDDLRVVILFDERGNEVCRAHGEGRWGMVPHDERMRAMAFRALSKQDKERMPHDGPLAALFAQLQAEAETSSSAALKLAHCLSVLGKHFHGEAVDAQYVAQLIGSGEIVQAAALCKPAANDPSSQRRSALRPETPRGPDRPLGDESPRTVPRPAVRRAA
jgi:putative transposase